MSKILKSYHTFFTALFFMAIFLSVITSCSSDGFSPMSKKIFADKLSSFIHQKKTKKRQEGPLIIKKQEDAIAAIWLRQSFKTLGTPSFMENYAQFKKRTLLLDNQVYAINVYELIYYHYVTIGDVDNARIYLNRAFRYFIKIGKEQIAYALPTYYLMMLISKNQTKKALEDCQYYLNVAKASGSQDNVARCFQLSAMVYKEIQMYSLAIPAYEKYIDVVKHKAHPDVEIFNDINALAEINYFIGNYVKMNHELILFDSLIIYLKQFLNF